MSPWEWDDAIHGWRNIDTGEVFTVDDVMARLEEFKADNAALREALETAEMEAFKIMASASVIQSDPAKANAVSASWVIEHVGRILAALASPPSESET